MSQVDAQNLAVPARLRAALVESQGQRAREWCDRLPGLVADLADRWSCVVAGHVLSGWAGVVVPVRRLDGSGAMLKLSFPDEAYRFEAAMLATWAGRGAVLLLERDDVTYAMLLEQLHPDSLTTVADADEAMTIIGSLARRLAVPAPAGRPGWSRYSSNGLPNFQPCRQRRVIRFPHESSTPLSRPVRSWDRNNPTPSSTGT